MTTQQSPHISCSEGGNSFLIFFTLTSDSSEQTRLLQHSAALFYVRVKFQIRQNISERHCKMRIDNVQTALLAAPPAKNVLRCKSKAAQRSYATGRRAPPAGSLRRNTLFGSTGGMKRFPFIVGANQYIPLGFSIVTSLRRSVSSLPLPSVHLFFLHS